MAKITNTFNQGLDRDSSKNKYDNVHYYDAKNMRLITQEGLSAGAMENLRGTYLRLNMPSGTDYICGHVVMGDHLVIWTTSNNAFPASPNGSSTDRIFKVDISDLEDLTGASSLTLSTSYYHNGGHLIYTGNLYLSTNNLIIAIARYENDSIQKVYWVDSYNRLRHVNTVYDADTNDLVNMTIDKLETIGDINLTQPEVTAIVGGDLRSGKIQYTYQLYGVHGTETVFAPLSGLVNLTSYSDNYPTTEDYRGSELDDNTGKAVKCSINVDTEGYTRIRLVAVHYTTLHGDPEIRIIEEREIASTTSTISFVDTGNTVGNLLLEDIRTLGTLLFSAAELETKDSILFPANITEESFDVDFDARAYRFAGNGAVTTDSNYNTISALRGVSRVYQEDDTYYEINGSTKVVSGTAPNASGSWTALDEKIDAINKFNDLNNDGDHAYRFMYQSDGIVPGGEGPNVSYTFKIRQMIIDEDTASAQRMYTTPEDTVANPSYDGYASPYNVEKYLGYHRDEIYRFGIVFFDGKGRSSFVKWIGDIRMPSISTLSNTTMYGDAGGGTDQITQITVDVALPTKYTVTIDGTPYEYDNKIPDLADENDIAIAVAAVIPSGIATCSAPAGGVFTMTFDQAPAQAHSVNTSTHLTDVLLQAYSGGTSSKSDFSIAWNDAAGTGETKGNMLYLEFEVDNLPAGVESYQIVRVRRESTDRSVMAQGVIAGTELTGSDLEPHLWRTGSGFSNVYTFQSPEVAFNKNLTRQANDFLQEVGELLDDVTDITATVNLSKYNNITALTNPQLHLIPTSPTASTVAAGDEHWANSKTDITSGRIVRQDEVEAAIGSYVYYVNRGAIAAANYIDKGICFVFEASNTSWRSKNKPYTHATDGRKLVNYRREIFNTQYDGLTYNNRRQNKYIVASSIQSINSSTVAVYGGDTYIGFFDYLYSSWEQEAVASGQPEVIYFPCETSVNLPLRLDECYHRVYSNDNVEFIHDTAGVWAGGAVVPPQAEFAQPNDLYRYNTVYSKENDSKIFIQAPFDWSEETDFPVRTYASNLKIVNEYTDNWLKFRVNSYKDVDPQFGEITKLINVNEKLMFFQPKAFGILSVNERALLQTTDISQLSLGVSGVLARYDYAKTQIGASDTRHVLLTPNGLYWIDTINKAMYKYTGGPEEVSMMKGMDSFFRTSLINGTSSFLFHDPEFKEVMINDHSDNWTLVYNELTDSFTGFNDFFPDYVINYNDKLWGSRNNIAFYKHNDTYANRGYLYGSYYDSSITLLINPNGDNTAIFNNMEWLTEVLTSAGVEADVTFNEIQFWNDYQGSISTGTTLTSGTNVKRRMRKWRYTIPRVGYEKDGSTPKNRTDARFRDTHLFAKLSYTNDANDRRFITHDLMTSFTTSNM